MAEHGLYVGDRISEADRLAELRLELDEALRQLQTVELELRTTHDRYRGALDVLHGARKATDDQVLRMHRQVFR